MAPTIGILGPSMVGKSTMVDLLSPHLHTLKQVTCRRPRADDRPDRIIHCSPEEFRGRPREDFLVRHGDYGILRSEYEEGLSTGRPMMGVMGVFEVIQLKTQVADAIVCLLQFPHIDKDEIRRRVAKRGEFNLEERLFENAVYQDVFYTEPDFLREYVDLTLISELERNHDNVKRILSLIQERPQMCVDKQ